MKTLRPQTPPLRLAARFRQICCQPSGRAALLAAGLATQALAILAGMAIPDLLVTLLLVAWVAIAAIGLRAMPSEQAND